MTIKFEEKKKADPELFTFENAPCGHWLEQITDDEKIVFKSNCGDNTFLIIFHEGRNTPDLHELHHYIANYLTEDCEVLKETDPDITIGIQEKP